MVLQISACRWCLEWQRRRPAAPTTSATASLTSSKASLQCSIVVSASQTTPSVVPYLLSFPFVAALSSFVQVCQCATRSTGSGTPSNKRTIKQSKQRRLAPPPPSRTPTLLDLRVLCRRKKQQKGGSNSAAGTRFQVVPSLAVDNLGADTTTYDCSLLMNK